MRLFGSRHPERPAPPGRASGADVSPERIGDAMARDHSTRALPVEPDGYLYGPVAQGLALSGPMGIGAHVAWNSLTDTGDFSYTDARDALVDLWDIDDEDSWFAALNRLVESTWGDTWAYHAVAVRTRVRVRTDVPALTDAQWERALVEDAAASADPAAVAQRLVDAVPAVRRAEDTLRAARLLAADEVVEALDGYDYVRALHVARWGVRIGWGDPHVVRTVALALHDAAAARYGSWRAYGIGLSAGRIVDHPDPGSGAVVDTIESVRPFLDSIESPWNNLPFPTGRILGDDPDRLPDR